MALFAHDAVFDRNADDENDLDYVARHHEQIAYDDNDDLVDVVAFMLAHDALDDERI